MSKIADIDSMISIGQRVEALRAENAGFREAGDRMARSLDFMLSEHDRLQAENKRLLSADDFLQRLLDGLDEHLPHADERSVEDLVAAVADMALKLDAHEDASTPAFDEIVKLCGLAKTWEYPGQVIRDVRDALARRDARIAQLEAQQDQPACSPDMNMTNHCNLCPACRAEVERFFDDAVSAVPVQTSTAAMMLEVFVFIKHLVLGTLKDRRFFDELQRMEDLQSSLYAREQDARRRR